MSPVERGKNVFPNFGELAETADKLGDAATDIASRVESIENLLREQNALIAQAMEHAGIKSVLATIVASRPLMMVLHNVPPAESPFALDDGSKRNPFALDAMPDEDDGGGERP